MSRFVFDESIFWDDPNYIELKPGWWIRKVPGEKFLGGLPLHPHDPIFTPLAIAAVVTAGTMQAVSSYRQGKEAERLSKTRAAIAEQNAQRQKELAERRAAIELENARRVKEEAAEEARLEEEKGQKFLQRQKALFAAGNIRIDVGAPLVIEAQTKRDLAMQKGFILEEGRDIADIYRMRAEYEKEYGSAAMAGGLLEAAYEKQAGRAARRQSKWDMWSSILSTGETAGTMGYRAGWFGGKGTITMSSPSVKVRNPRSLKADYWSGSYTRNFPSSYW